MLNRDEILSKTKLKTQVVEVPEWEGSVIISEMSGSTRDAWEQSLQERDVKGNVISPRAKLVIATVIDDQGNRLFSDSDIDAVGKLSSRSLSAICEVAQKLNFILADDLENAEKN